MTVVLWVLRVLCVLGEELCRVSESPACSLCSPLILLSATQHDHIIASHTKIYMYVNTDMLLRSPHNITYAFS